MEAPAYFVATLEQQFQSRLRIRWSTPKEEWHIEERVGRSTFENPERRESDPWIRARDGYAHVMAIKPHDWMFCPNCHAKLAVPLFETAEAKCSACNKAGREAHFRAAFYPLDDHLIDFLHSIDPLRTNIAQAQCDAADLANAQVATSAERTTHNYIEDTTKENWRQLAGIQGVGYTKGLP